MRSMRLVDVLDEQDGITCTLCQSVNDGGKRLVHAERMGDLHIIQQQDYCDECLDGLVRVVIGAADASDLDMWEQNIWEAKQAYLLSHPRSD